MMSVRRAWRVTVRNAHMWRNMAAPSLVGNVAEPLLYLLVLGYGMGEMIDDDALPEGVSYRFFYGSGLIMSVAMFAASFENLFGAFTRMMGQRTYEAIIATPITLAEVLWGDTLFAAIKGVVAGTFVPVVLVALGEPVSPMLFLGLPALGLTALVFAAVALLVMSYSPDYAWFNFYMTLVLAPLFLFSGIFFPIEQFGDLTWLAQLSPLAMGVEVVRPLALGQWPELTPVVSMAVLMPVTTIFALHFAHRKLHHRLIG
jgi:lipooligosaccharide transport system permease protein